MIIYADYFFKDLLRKKKNLVLITHSRNGILLISYFRHDLAVDYEE